MSFARLTPESDERPAGHIESSVASFRYLLRTLKYREEIAADGYGRPSCLRAEPHELAVGAVVAHHRIELREPLECGGAGAFRCRLVRRIDHQPDIDAHMIFGINEPCQRSGIGTTAGCRRHPPDEKRTDKKYTEEKEHVTFETSHLIPHSAGKIDIGFS